MSISITATTSDISVSASATDVTATVADSTVTLAETITVSGFAAGNLLDLSGR